MRKLKEIMLFNKYICWGYYRSIDICNRLALERLEREEHSRQFWPEELKESYKMLIKDYDFDPGHAHDICIDMQELFNGPSFTNWARLIEIEKELNDL